MALAQREHRKILSLGVGFLTALLFASASIGSACAETLEQITAAALKEGHVVWYDSLPREQGEAILAEFAKAYPGIKPDYLEVPGSEKAARINQESGAGGPTADVSIDNASAIMRFVPLGYVAPVDWASLGVEPSPRVPNEYMIAVTTTTFGVLYNTDKIGDAEAPHSYETLTDPKWMGRIGLWARANGLSILPAAWGEQKTTAFVRKLAALKPRLFRSTYAEAESVGAGEIDLAFTIYHTTLPTVRKGAPVKWIFLEPIQAAVLYGNLLKEGRNPNAGKLLLKWLGSTQGSLIYERVSDRGNILVPETKTAQMLAGKEIVMFDVKTEVEKADWLNGLEEQYTRLLQGR